MQLPAASEADKAPEPADVATKPAAKHVQHVKVAFFPPARFAALQSGLVESSALLSQHC